MANALYPSFKKLLLDGDIDLLTDTIRVALIDTGVYTYSSAHDFYDDAVAGLVGAAVTLTSKTTTGGVFDAADAVVSAVTGNTAEAVIIYKSTGTNSTSPLIAYIDTATGLPVTPNGGDITITWDNGANKIFAL